MRSLECQGLLASECDCGVSGGVWNSELHQGDVTAAEPLWGSGETQALVFTRGCWG